MHGPWSNGSAVHRTGIGRWLALGFLLIALQATGCFQSNSEPQSGPLLDPSQNIPTLAELQQVVGFSAAQSAALEPAHAAWQRAEQSWDRAGRPFGEPPVLDFIAAGARILDRAQLASLVVALRDFAGARNPSLDLDEALFGPPDPRAPMGHHGPGHRGPGHGIDPFAGLGLTTEQLTQIRQAHDTLRAAVAALIHQLRDGTITEEQFEAGVAAARAAYETALQGILTAEQHAQLQQLRRDRMIAKLTGLLENFSTAVARRVTGLDRILELSDAQATEIQSILAGTEPPLQAVLAGLQAGSLSPQDAEAQLGQIETDATAAIRATLTESQAAIFDRLRSLRQLHPGCHP